MKSFASIFFNFLVKQNKLVKLAIVAFTDSLIIFSAFVMFFVMPAIIMTGFDRPLILYFSNTYFLNFFISLIFYQLSMFANKGLTEIQRSFIFQDLVKILAAVLIFSLCLLVLNSFSSKNISGIVVLFIQTLSTGAVSFMTIVISRLSFNYLSSLSSVKNRAVLIYGTGASARELFSSLAFTDKRVIAFISENKELIGRDALGIPIISWDRAKRTLDQDKTQTLYLASKSLQKIHRDQIIEDCVKIGIKVKKISAYSEMLREQEVSLTDLTISDIVPRSKLDSYESKFEHLSGKSVLITGAGGSIGSEICKVISAHEIKEIIMIDISEASLFRAQMEVSELAPDVKIIPIICDIRNLTKLDKIFKKFEPEYVYHTAAYKHVPILEEEDNYKEAFENNFLGSYELAKLSIKNEVKNFILVSTDKAVRPTNLMGASKRLAEIAIQSLSLNQDQTLFSCVRFGNVMDSSGSVLPTFRRQIKKGGPVTVTHPDIIRYFMSIGEAAYLVIMTSLIAERSKVYMLKMGEPVKIDDIAKRMIKLSGNNVKDNNEDDGIEIVYTGLRPGEKLFEELLVSDESESTFHPKIFVDSSTKNYTKKEFSRIVEELKNTLESEDFDGLKKLLKQYADYGKAS